MTKRCNSTNLTVCDSCEPCLTIFYAARQSDICILLMFRDCFIIVFFVVYCYISSGSIIRHAHICMTMTSRPPLPPPSGSLSLSLSLSLCVCVLGVAAVSDSHHPHHSSLPQSTHLPLILSSVLQSINPSLTLTRRQISF